MRLLWCSSEVIIAKVTDRGQSIEQYRAEGLAVVQDATFIGFLTTLKADPLAPAKLYALVTKELCCTDDIFALFQAVWVNVDGGRNWERLEPPLADGCTYPEVQIDPSDSSVYLGCGNELFKSTDGGASWTPKHFPYGARLWSLQVGPGNPAVLFGSLGVLWKSIDGAETWQRLGTLPATSDPRILTPHPVEQRFTRLPGSSGTDTRPSLPRPRRHDHESHVVPAPDRARPDCSQSAKELIVMGAATRAHSRVRRRLTK